MEVLERPSDSLQQHITDKLLRSNKPLTRRGEGLSGVCTHAAARAVLLTQHSQLEDSRMAAFLVNKKGFGAFSRRALAAASALALAGSLVALADDFGRDDKDRDHDRRVQFPVFFPGNLVVSRSVYDNKASNVTVGEILPPGCASTTGGCGASTGAPDNGTYPTVFNNDVYDSSFGITSKIFLDQITPFGFPINSLEVPNSSQHGITSTSDQLVTSFSSKSEIALHLSTDGKFLTFMGYVAPIDALDVSNSNTPGVVDVTNPVGQNVYRAVAVLDAFGHFHFTKTNAYSGNNGRSAILNNSDGANYYYTAGNAGNGANPQPEGVVLGAGAQFITPSLLPESQQAPGTPTPVANFSVTQVSEKADKLGKDDNFRGETIFNNVLYFTKGSGSNGINTVYFVDTTGTACPKGTGLPAANATLPKMPLALDPTTGTPTNMCVLAGFNAIGNKVQQATVYPFGLWFADANTVYVADEGDGYAGGTDLYTHAAAQTTAGLQKWVFDSTSNTWKLAYTLTNGLGLGTAYTVHGYPTGTNSATNLPWSPATDGLRNITGHVDEHGLVTIWGITSTVSGGGDTGADPNKLVVITDVKDNTDATSASNERFFAIKAAGFGEVLRGVSFTPETEWERH
jgi:hypothetical protein